MEFMVNVLADFGVNDPCRDLSNTFGETGRAPCSGVPETPKPPNSADEALSLGVFRRLLTLLLLQMHRDTNGKHIVIQIGGVCVTYNQREGIILQKYLDTNGRRITIFSKVLRSGVHVDMG